MTDILNFDDLTPIELPFSHLGKDYVLREATGEAACQFRNAQIACTTMGPEGKPKKFENVADVEPLLVSLCVWELLPDGKEKRVPEATVRQWSARMQKRLFEKAKEISDLNESAETLEELTKEYRELGKRIKKMGEEKEEAKND